MARGWFPKIKQEEFLHQIRHGMQRGAAIDFVFGDENPERRRRLREYIASNAEFEERVVDAEVDATEHVRDALYNAAISGGVAAAKAWLDLMGEGQGSSQKVERGETASTPSGGDAFSDLENVTPLDPRQRRKS